MCFYSKLTKKAEEIESRFKATFIDKNRYVPNNEIKAFDFPQLPVIGSANPSKLDFYRWGLIPEWSEDDTIKKYTLNARIETLNTKASFREYTEKRCLIPANGFYEWKWLDSKGKFKEKYEIGLKDESLFSFAGIWSLWKDPIQELEIHTFAVLTTQADSLMSEIHNTKKRMPVILTQENELLWLQHAPLENFKNLSTALVAKKISPVSPQFDLF
jgi:putative SOS response-associated peptidase YedK